MVLGSGTRRFPLAEECPLCGAERLEDGAPASRDRLRCGDYLVAMLYYR